MVLDFRKSEVENKNIFDQKVAEKKGIAEANDIAIKNGFDGGAKHLLNAVKDYNGAEYKTVQEIPPNVIKHVVNEREDAIAKREAEYKADREAKDKASKEAYQAETERKRKNKEGVSAEVSAEPKFAVHQRTMFDPINKENNKKPFTIVNEKTNEVISDENDKPLKFKTAEQAQKHIDNEILKTAEEKTKEKKFRDKMKEVIDAKLKDLEKPAENKGKEITPHKEVKATAKVAIGEIGASRALEQKDGELLYAMKNNPVDIVVPETSMSIRELNRDIKRAKEDLGAIEFFIKSNTPIKEIISFVTNYLNK